MLWAEPLCKGAVQPKQTVTSDIRERHTRAGTRQQGHKSRDPQCTVTSYFGRSALASRTASSCPETRVKAGSSCFTTGVTTTSTCTRNSQGNRSYSMYWCMHTGLNSAVCFAASPQAIPPRSPAPATSKLTFLYSLVGACTVV